MADINKLSDKELEAMLKGSVSSIQAPDLSKYSDTDIAAMGKQLEATAAPLSGLESYGAGLAQTGKRIGAGAEDIWEFGKHLYHGQLGEPSPAQDAIKERMAKSEAEYRARTREHPYAAFAGEASPYALIPIGGGPASALTLGAATGALTYSPDPRQRAANIGIGALAGPLQKLIPKQSMMIPGASQEARRASALGYQLTPGQMFGAPEMSRFESAVSTLPFVGSPYRRMAANNNRVATEIAARNLGLDSTRIRPEQLGKLAKDI